MANDTMEKPTQAEEGVWVTGPDGDLIPDYESTFPTINEGEVVHGTVVRVDKDEVLVDIGYKSEGVIPVAELSIRRSVNPADEVSVGEEIEALVLQVHDELLLEAPETETSAVKELVREEMCGAYPLDPPLAVDVGHGDDWNEAK